MRWAVNLYTTQSTKKALPRIMQRIRKRRLQPDVKVITLASNEKNLLDIVPAEVFLQKGLSFLNPDIVGLAKGQEEAEELAVQILLDVFEKSGGFDVRKYFEFRE